MPTCRALRVLVLGAQVLILERINMWKLGLLWWKFKKELLMVWAMLRNPAAPALSKLVVLLAAIYIVSPVDLIPDVLPVLGWLDDGVISMLLFKLAFKLLPKEMYNSLKAQFEKKGGKVDNVIDVVDVKPK